jgi:hypothetical protein
MVPDLINLTHRRLCRVEQVLENCKMEQRKPNPKWPSSSSDAIARGSPRGGPSSDIDAWRI